MSSANSIYKQFGPRAGPAWSRPKLLAFLKDFLEFILKIAVDDKIHKKLHSIQRVNEMSRDMWFPTIGILTSVDSDEPVKPPFKLRNSKLCSVSSLTLIEC